MLQLGKAKNFMPRAADQLVALFGSGAMKADPFQRDGSISPPGGVHGAKGASIDLVANRQLRKGHLWHLKGTKEGTRLSFRLQGFRMA
eukprot:2606319-Prymnesium_polylepis.1